MKRKFLFLTLFALAACTGREAEAPDVTLIRARVDEASRTVLDGRKVRWTAGDALVVNGVASTAISLKDGGLSADFSFPGTLSAPYYALYPASRYVAASYKPLNARYGSVVLPSAQTWTEGSFDPSAALLYGYQADKSEMALRCGTAFIRLTVTGAPALQRVEFSAVGGEGMSGEMQLQSGPKLKMTGSGGGVTVSGAPEIPAGRPVIAAIAAGNYASGVKMRIVDSNNHFQDLVSAKAFEACEGVMYDTEVAYVPTGTLVEGTSDECHPGALEIVNPVWAKNWPDPTVFYDAATRCWCSFSTEGSGKRNYLVSPDLVHWEDSGKRLIAASAYTVMTGYANHRWAPAYAFIGGKHMLYVSVVLSGGDHHDTRIVALRSENIRGPYEFVSVVTAYEDTGIKDTIDPFVLEADGKVWMAFGSIGKMHIVQLNAEGSALAPGAEYKHIAGLTSAENPSRSGVYEGAYLYKRNGWWYLFASGGLYSNTTYKLVCGRSQNITGPYLDRNGVDMRQGLAPALLSTDPACADSVFGPGHNGEIFTDKTRQDYIFYHCHYRPSPDASETRMLFLQRLFWDAEGWPYFETGHPLLRDVAPQL